MGSKSDMGMGSKMKEAQFENLRKEEFLSYKKYK
jgi:hypothetical protein